MAILSINAQEQAQYWIPLLITQFLFFYKKGSNIQQPNLRLPIKVFGKQYQIEKTVKSISYFTYS